MEDTSSKTLRISRSGLVLCPSCMTHFSVKAHALVESVCPFCNQTLASSILGSSQSKSLASRRTMRGKSAALLATLGVSVTLFACDFSSSHTPEPSAVEPAVDTANEPGAAQASSPPQPEQLSPDIYKQLKRIEKLRQRSENPSEFEAELTSNIMYGTPPIEQDDEAQRKGDEAKRKAAEKIAEVAGLLLYGAPPIQEEEEDVQPANTIKESE